MKVKEKFKGHCDNCGKPFTYCFRKGRNGKYYRSIITNYLENQRVCINCYNRYKKRGTFDYVRPRLSPEEKERKKKYEKKIKKMLIIERTKLLKEISPEQLLKEVGYE